MGKTPTFITPAQAGKVLGLKERQVRNLCKSGVLPAQQAGKTWIIQREDLAKVPKVRKPGPKPGAKRKAAK